MNARTVLFALATFFLTAGCNPENPEGPDVTEDEFAFNMDVKADGLSLIVTTAPTDKNFPYYLEPIPASLYEDAGMDATAFFSGMMEEYGVYFGSPAEAFGQISMTGDKHLKYDISRHAEEKFYVLLAGIDQDLNLTTTVECVAVDIELPESDNEFDVSVDVIEQDRIVFTIRPLYDDLYAVVLQDTETVNEMSDTQLRSFLSSLVWDSNVFIGEISMEYAKNISPSHDYSLFVFGWDGTFTTDLYRTDVRTLDPEDVDELTFELDIDVHGPTEATAYIVPSNNKATYFYDVMSMSDWTGTYNEDPSLYIKAMADNMYRTEAEYLDLFGSVGPEEYYYDSFYLSPGNDFVLFALGYSVNDDGSVSYLAPQHIEFSTPEE